MPSAPIAIPPSSSTMSMSTSPSTGRYVPVHKRSPSASRTVPVLTYSRDELLALAPSTSWAQPEALSSSPQQFHHLQQHVEPHQGWAQAHEAMRNYLRVVCPEIALNRKMRKSLQYHQHQQHQHQQRVASPARQQHPRPHSPASSSTSSEEQQHRERQPVKRFEQPMQQQIPSRPATPSSFKRVTPRRGRPATRTNTRTARLNGFTAFHKQMSGVPAAAEADWRRGGVVRPVTVSAAH